MDYKKINTYLLVLLLLITPAFSIGVDAPDDFLLSRGDSISASFIVTDVNGTFNVKSDHEYITIKNQQNNNGYWFVTYDISIPEDAPIGVTRAYIDISDTTSTTYMNIKMSIQRNFFKSLLNFLLMIPSWLIVLIIGLITIIIINFGWKKV